ncbi:MAG: 2-oxo acid dehydrogenase subunit E2 [Burkholderiales bacterium]|nr:2-oxo acid dehydrogenase subunit E2 [Anaerolineae bacterium]
MYADVVLPNLGFGMEEGKLVSWLKKPGDTVRKGEAIAEIEGDKATVELEAVTDGILHEALFAADTVVPVGSVLARIRTGADANPSPVPSPQAERGASGADIGAGAELAPTEDVRKPQLAADDSSGDERISPVAARLARELSVDLSKVAGSGPGGRITRADVEVAVNSPASGSNGASRGLAAPAVRRLARDNSIELGHIQGTGRDGRVTRADVEATIAAQVNPSPSPSPQAERGAVAVVAAPQVESVVIDGRSEVELSRMRRAIAGRLQQSMNEAPHFYTTAELDLTDALKVLPRLIGINNLLLYIATQTLMAMPELNATYENGHLYHYEHVNLSLAVALPNGLMSPVLHRADDYSLAGLADRSRDLIKRTRDNKLRPEELGGGTFTLSNLGLIEQVERFTAIINPPQVAILAIGAAKERPFVINGGIYVRKTVYLTLSADHRIIDGMVAGQFLQAFDERLQAFNQ